MEISVLNRYKCLGSNNNQKSSQLMNYERISSEGTSTVQLEQRFDKDSESLVDIAGEEESLRWPRDGGK